MKKYEVIKESSNFDYIINNGKNIKNKYYSIYYIENMNNFPKFGLAIGKKIGNAVCRNKLKRQLRNIVDNNKKLFNNSTYYIIMVRKLILTLSFSQMEDEFLNLILKEKNNEK